MKQAPSANVSAPDSIERRRIALLRIIAERGGTISPKPNPEATHGYDFGELDAEVRQDLEFLAGHDYLERRFLDRVTTCPRCSSHHLNLREACPACGSANHVDEPLLHHFRCGYVARISEFDGGDGHGERVCPKCARALRHLGTDYDRMGQTYLCRQCSTSFQDPPVRALCLACANDTASSDLLSVDVHSFALTSLGSAAVRRGRLFESAGEFLLIGSLPVYRRSVILELINQETKRLARFKGKFSLLLVRFTEPASDSAAMTAEENVIQTLADTVRGCDLLGQISAHCFVACLPETTAQGTKRLRERFAKRLGREAPRFEELTIEVAQPFDVVARLEQWARRT